MAGHALRNFDAPAVGQVIGNSRCAEAVTADRGFNAGIDCTPADHVPNIGPGEGAIAERFRPANRRAKEGPLAVFPDPGRRQIRVHVFIQLVVARHFRDFAVLLAQPQPPALLLREVVFDAQADNRANPREAVGHDGDDGAIAKAHDAGDVHGGE